MRELVHQRLRNLRPADALEVTSLAVADAVNRLWQPGVSSPLNTSPGGHCNVAFGSDQKMYNANLKCTMHSGMYSDPNDMEPRDGIVGFHYVRVGPAIDSEYLRIRRRAEPVPQNEGARLQPQ